VTRKVTPRVFHNLRGLGFMDFISGTESSGANGGTEARSDGADGPIFRPAGPFVCLGLRPPLYSEGWPPLSQTNARA
jgi:hypothetical protein